MATFRVRESGYVQAIVRRNGFPDQSKTFRTKTQAEAWARKIESDMDSGAFVSFILAERTTFKELADRFSEEFAPYHYRDAHWPGRLAHLVKKLGKYTAWPPSRLRWWQSTGMID